MVTLQLSEEDARFLCGQLDQQLAHVESELVHTDKHEMQHELARDLERLHHVLAKLRRAVEEGKTERVAELR